ncbi:MAG: lipoprotein [Gammaproteobacteria bacterium]|nr:lipoprotein [Gammaproteobacteria bacterium]
MIRLIFLGFFFLTGCGQTGGLYLPPPCPHVQ